MKIELSVIKEFEVKYLQANCYIRHAEDMNGITHAVTGETWNPLIDIDTGTILDWEDGEKHLHLKVCDSGNYSLLDENKEEITSYEGYVPKILCPNENGYGDYVILDIDSSGVIKHFTNDDVDEFIHDDNDW